MDSEIHLSTDLKKKEIESDTDESLNHNIVWINQRIGSEGCNHYTRPVMAPLEIPQFWIQDFMLDLCTS